jgi:phenylpyruvate tautomerase PptA (4-oxalocrotonate tautomerase family)
MHMPLAKISLRKGKSAEFRRAVTDGIYLALRETFDVPEDDRFMLISEFEPENFIFGPQYLGIARSDALVIIELTVSQTRTLAQKKSLYRRIAERLTADPGLRSEDVFINLVEVATANWSFGHGVAQYAAD